MNEEELKAENQQLREVIKSLRRQIEVLKGKKRKNYEYDGDFLPYEDRDEFQDH